MMRKTFSMFGILIVLVGVGIWISQIKTTNEANIFEGKATVSGGKITEIKEFTIIGKNFSFEPATIKVQNGDKIKILFKNEQGFHDLKIDELNVASRKLQNNNEDIIEFTANQIGSFEYYCSIGTHRAMGMKGKFIVEE